MDTGILHSDVALSPVPVIATELIVTAFLKTLETVNGKSSYISLNSINSFPVKLMFNLFCEFNI